DADRPVLPHDPDAGDRRLAGPQAAGAALGGDISYREQAVLRAAARGGHPGRRADVLPGARPRSDRRTPHRSLPPLMETRVMAPATTPPAGEHHGGARKQSMFEPAILRRAVGDAIGKLDPRQMWRNP